jgi:hypothetical protein
MPLTARLQSRPDCLITRACTSSTSRYSTDSLRYSLQKRPLLSESVSKHQHAQLVSRQGSSATCFEKACTPDKVSFLLMPQLEQKHTPNPRQQYGTKYLNPASRRFVCPASQFKPLTAGGPWTGMPRAHPSSTDTAKVQASLRCSPTSTAQLAQTCSWAGVKEHPGGGGGWW